METLRRRKKKAQEARWRAMTPAQRLLRASAMTEAALKLRAAGLAALGMPQAASRGKKRPGG